MRARVSLLLLVLAALSSLPIASVKSQEDEFEYRGPRIDEVILSVMPEAEAQ
jgi:hypothetical protein